MNTSQSTVAPLGRDGDRLFMSAKGLLPRAEFVRYLNQCADDWMKIADGSFYGILRKTIDAEAVRQSNKVRLKAQEIADENKTKHA